MEKLSPKKELTLLRSAVIGLVGRDQEGAYRPEFVRRALKALGEKPVGEFVDADSFLKKIGEK